MSKLADLSLNAVVKTESDDSSNPTIEVVQKMAKALEISVNGLLKKQFMTKTGFKKKYLNKIVRGSAVDVMKELLDGSVLGQGSKMSVSWSMTLPMKKLLHLLAK